MERKRDPAIPRHRVAALRALTAITAIDAVRMTPHAPEGGPFAREDLVQILLGDDAAAAAAIRRLTSANGWPHALAVADAWSVAPNLRARLHSLGLDAPTPVRRELFFRSQRSFAAATLQARRGVRLCRYLEERGIPAVVFKGLASIAHLHGGSVAHRVIKDVDVLIRPRDLPQVLDALQSTGMQCEDGGSLGDYLAFVRNSPGFGGNEAITLRGEDQADLDVHWSIGPSTHPGLHVDAIVARAERVALFGASIRVVTPADGLMLSAHHSIRETFAADQMLRDVLDTAGWLTLLAQRGCLADALQQASACRMDVPVLALAEILVRRSGRQRIAPTDARAERLAELFDLQVREGPIEKDVTYLADTYAFRQIVSGLVSAVLLPLRLLTGAGMGAHFLGKSAARAYHSFPLGQKGKSKKNFTCASDAPFLLD